MKLPCHVLIDTATGIIDLWILVEWDRVPIPGSINGVVMTLILSHTHIPTTSLYVTFLHSSVDIGSCQAVTTMAVSMSIATLLLFYYYYQAYTSEINNSRNDCMMGLTGISNDDHERCFLDILWPSSKLSQMIITVSHSLCLSSYNF